MNQTDVIIVGGGVIGLLTAYYLNENGASVTLIEKNRIGKESSWAGGGILSPLYPWRYSNPVNDLAISSQKDYAHFCKSLHQRTGIDPEWVKSGLLLTEPFRTSDAFSVWEKKYKPNIETLTGKQLQHYEPALSSTQRDALWFPDIAQIRNPRLLTSLLADIKSKGVKVIENQPLNYLLRKNGRAIGVKTTQQNYFSDATVIACGAWSNELELPIDIKVKPVLGQIILYKTAESQLTRIILNNGKYLIPRKDGHILCGSTLEWKGFDKVTTHLAKKELRNFAAEQLPFLADLKPIQHWSGLRPGSPNSVPYIGEHEIKGLYFNTGHYRYGVTMGPASAQLLTDILLKRPSSFNIDNYSLSAKREQTGEFDF